MATTHEATDRTPHSHGCYAFTLILSGFDAISDEIENAIYEAGCDDAMLGIQGGSPFLSFDREADSLDEALHSAIKDAEKAGLGIEVVRVVLPGAETVDRLNDYLQMRRQVLKRFAALGPEIAQRLDVFLSAIAENDAAALTKALNAK